MLQSISVVRVYLHGQVLLRVDELDEDRQLRPAAHGMERVGAEPFRMAREHTAQGLPAHKGLPVRVGAALPGLGKRL